MSDQLAKITGRAYCAPAKIVDREGSMPGARGVTNPAELLLRVTPTDAGLRFSSPQLPGWATVARGALPVASAVDVAMRELQAASYARSRRDRYDLAAWDAAAELFARDGRELQTDDVVVVREGARARSDRKAAGRDRHSPEAWEPQVDGSWISPGGYRYGAGSLQVQRVIAQRQALATQMSLGEVAS